MRQNYRLSADLTLKADTIYALSVSNHFYDVLKTLCKTDTHRLSLSYRLAATELVQYTGLAHRFVLTGECLSVVLEQENTVKYFEQEKK
jgi:hypothetical protein